MFLLIYYLLWVVPEIEPKASQLRAVVFIAEAGSDPQDFPYILIID